MALVRYSRRNHNSQVTKLIMENKANAIAMMPEIPLFPLFLVFTKQQLTIRYQYCCG